MKNRNKQMRFRKWQLRKIDELLMMQGLFVRFKCRQVILKMKLSACNSVNNQNQPK